MDPNNIQSNTPILDPHLSDVIEVLLEEENILRDNLQPMDGPSTSNGQKPMNTPYIKIIEQPASKALRFRYKCEGRSAGSIPGVNSTSENKTYPTIQIVGYNGRAVVVVSCVTNDTPYRPHPHNLVGRENCKRGICTIEINNDSMTASFQNLGIQCVKRIEIADALQTREEIRVDPFRTGFSHKDNPTSIDLNVVRLCFQAFLGGGSQKGKYSILEPVVSDPIYDKKAMSDLVICRLSDASASVLGGKDIILLCEKVAKDDIQIRFFEEKDGECIWEGYADFQQTDVHKQVAIHFRTPIYKTIQIDKAVKVLIQLKRPSDGSCSEPRQFILTPAESVISLNQVGNYPIGYMEKTWKRRKISSESEILRQIPSAPPKHPAQSSNVTEGMMVDQPIKIEPETSHSSYLYTMPSPHVLQPSPSYISRTPSPLVNPFPNINPSNLYGHASLPQTGIQTNHSMSGCITTEFNPTLNSQDTLPQTNYSPPLLGPTEDNNDPNLMDTFSSFDRLDTNELRSLMVEDSEQVLSADLSARLQLDEGNVHENEVQDSMNMTDSYERIANNTLENLLSENYQIPNQANNI